MKKYSHLFGMVSIFFLVIFIPILFCIFVWGNDIDYNLACKLVTLRDNKILLLLCVPILLFFFVFFYLTRKVNITKKLSIIMNVCLVMIFSVVFMVNLEVCKCLNLADGIESFTYAKDFMWVIVICIMVSVTGYFMCVSVKKITQNFAVTCISCFLYVACVCVTPWKTVPYTDMFAIMFPLLCVSLYIFHYYSKNIFVWYLLWFLIFLFGFIGSLMKPTVFIVPIAIVLCEMVKGLANLRENWKKLVVKLALIVLAFFMYCGCKQYIYEDVGYEPNEESEFTAIHFLMMGLNEQSTGSFHSGDVAISGNVPLLEDRTEKQIEVIKERLEEKGFFGYMNFLLRKMVMTFNDGAFGWGREGGYTLDVYPIYKNSFDVALIKDIFIPNYLYSGQFNTYSQMIWLLIIFCIPGFCFMDKGKREVCMPILVSLLGIVFYLMLFEARARYLICFLPVIIMAAAIGMKQYYEILVKVMQRVYAKINFKRSKG